jgi:PilZ domain
MNDHRIAPRHRTLKAGTIEFSGTKIDCLIRNISATGAALEIRSPLWFPDVFRLVTTSDGNDRLSRVVWRNDRRIGVVFED